MARAWLSALVLLASACATPYQEMDSFLGGVDAIQLSETSYRITVSGNQRTTSERVQDFVLLRASEIAFSRGYKGFVVNQQVDQSRITQVVIPTSDPIVSSWTPYVAYFSPAITHTIVEPGVAAYITLVQEVHEGGMDARITYNSVAPKYGLQPAPVAPSK